LVLEFPLPEGERKNGRNTRPEALSWDQCPSTLLCHCAPPVGGASCLQM